MSYDIIGDIHGHADHLKALLANLGYHEIKGAWRHVDRRALFVGDFIDVGPKQVETVEIVRRMVDAETARAVLGNHELNAIAWFLCDPENPGDFLRSHFSPHWGAKNREQHEAFLAEVEHKPEHKEIIDWFLTLPLWLDLPEVRVVHACWHQRFMDYLAPMLLEGNRLDRDMMVHASREPADNSEKDSPAPTIFKATEALTKGIEIPLPEGYSFQDKYNFTRNRMRVRWWDPKAVTYRNAAMLSPGLVEKLPDISIPEHRRVAYQGEKPLFVGHYWVTGDPAPLSDKVACVDYSVAKGGKLVAYCWDGEDILSASKFRFVEQVCTNG
jgi:hypothetical protein